MSRPVEGSGGRSPSASLAEGDPARFYEIHQEWPKEVKAQVAEYLHSPLRKPAPRACLFLGAATGVNDVLPFARLADTKDRVWGTDVVPTYLDRLREHVQAMGLKNVEPRAVDIRSDLAGLGRFDLVTLLFVIHRLEDWQSVLAPLAGLLGSGGSLFVSEFVGPSGVIYASNERGGSGQDPVSRLIRRHFELLPEAFTPPLKSTWIGPVRERLAELLCPEGFRDFVWTQRLRVRDMHEKIASKAYAPYFSTQASTESLERLRREFAGEWETVVELQETIRIYRYAKA